MHRWLSAAIVFAVACAPSQSFVPDADGARTDAASGPDVPTWTECVPGQTRCVAETFQTCVPDREMTAVRSDDCRARMMTCVADRGGCVPCRPGGIRCAPDDSAVERCRDDAMTWERATECDVPNGMVCRGERCRSLCDDPDVIGSYIGCEYFAVDLDNAVLGVGETAASQQYAVVVSNPDPRYTARVTIERNDAPVGAPPRIVRVQSTVIPPRDLEVFLLNAREVDCSAPGTFNTGTGTCLSSLAYRVTSTAPVIAYQFNPLENGLVFSNDSCLLIPTNSLQGDYMAMGWPQTLASSPPETVLNPSSPVDLRAFITVVGVRPNTHVHIVPRADVLPGGPFVERIPAGSSIDIVLGTFDVLNLETDGFEADLTGTRVTADGPVAVFSGSEASDVPEWFDLNDRRCCADHLEAQQFPRNSLGQRYVAVRTPRRTPIVRAAGAPVGLVENEPEFFRVMAVTPGTTTIRTTLPSILEDPESPPLAVVLREGEFRTLRAYRDFELIATAPISLADFMSSQTNTGIPLNFPGGDPSFIPIPPIEQWRSTYVFLTPDRYAFDFVAIVAPVNAEVRLDDVRVPSIDCDVSRGDGCVDTRRQTCGPSRYTVYRCQLSYPIIDPILPYPMNVLPGRQRDGVHVVTASEPVGVIVSGFDLRVSYGYPAGTQLRTLF